MMDQYEKEQAAQLQAEYRVPADWTVKKDYGLWRIQSPALAARQIAELNGLEPDLVAATLDEHVGALEMPEGGAYFFFQSPDKERQVLITASPRDMKKGSKAYLDRLNLDQLEYIREESSSRIEKIKEEPRRTMWQVVDSGMSCASFREENYLAAVECMAEKARQRYEKNKEAAQQDPRALKISIQPVRMYQSEYDEMLPSLS